MKKDSPLREEGEGGLRVSDLVAMTHLGIEVLAGAGGLEHRIEWAHVSELEDPGPWLERGEMLIVNGFGVPSAGFEQARYVERLAEHGVVALGVGGRTPPVRTEMLEAAEKADLPILRIPKETPFVAISHLVANAGQRSAQRRLVRHLQILETLRLRDGIRAGTRTRFAEMEDASGYRLALVSGAGYPVLAEWPWVPPDLDIDALNEGGGDRVIIDGGYALPIPVGHRIAAFLIAIEQEGVEPAGLSALQHIATVAALEVLDEYRQHEAYRRHGAEALAELMTGNLTAEGAAVRLEQEDLRRDDPLVLAALRGTTGTIDDDDLHRRLRDRGIKHLILRQDELYVLHIADQTHALEAVVQDLDIMVGISSVIANRGQLDLARREALWSLACAGRAPGQRVIRFGSDDGFARWFPADLDALESIAKATLGELIAYDADQHTDLVATLTAYFRNQRKVRQTAAELFVHENTLSYRLK
ncbi:MAG: PucR family transcriptional regulator ligand-binding domain-containing protein, partial [Actinobacteria bacterium]|nr:PucR family transcriptional regulator ligand-binding domain-containing protein [Actinomycetota bacterium]